MIASTFPAPRRLIGLQRALAMLTLAAVLTVLLPLALRTPVAPASQHSAGLPLIVLPTSNPAAPFGAFGAGDGVTFEPDGLSLAFADERLGVRFIGANADVVLEPTDQRAGTISRYVGDPSTWRDRIPTYAALTYRSLFSGIDLRYDGQNGDLKGTYFVAPHANPAAIRWRYAGATSLAIDAATGDLLIGTAGGAMLRETAPVAWQDLPGGRVPVAASFDLTAGVASFQLGAYDPSQPLVIDPTLTLGSYLGGSSADYGRGIAVDKEGAIYVVGDFFSSDFLGFDTAPSGSKDVIVLKLTPAGNDLVHGSFIGGSGTDEGLAITVNGAGEAFVLIDPESDFPLHNASIDTAPAVGDGILLKYDAGGDLLYSTYLGFGLANLYTGKAITIGPDGKLYITGQTYIAERRLAQVALVEVNPATGAIVRSFERGDSYVTTDGAAVAVGPGGRIYLTGTTGSPFGQFPTTANAFQKQCGRKLILGEERDCDENAYLMVLSPDLQVQYASYLGGSGSDEGRGLAVDREGNAIIVGNATSEDFPMKNAILPACPADPELNLCSYDGFATKLSPSSGLIYSTYITALGAPEAMTFVNDVAVDATGNAYVAGFSNAAGLPLKNAIQTLGQGELCGGLNRFCFDAYVLGLAPDGSLRFGSHLGGRFDEYSQDIAVDSTGAIYLIGYSDGSGFPTTGGSIQPTKSANYDFFVAKIAFASGTPPPPAPVPPPAPDLPYKTYLPTITR